MSRKVCCLVILLIFGGLLLIAGCILIGLYETIIHYEIKQQINLKKDGSVYNNWVVPPAPVYFQIYAFTLDNPATFMAGGKPFVTQKGPYTYREHRKKVDITYNSNSTVSYKEIRWFEFDEEKSNGSEDDPITTLNVPLMTAAELIQKEYSFLKELVELILDWGQETLVMNLTVKGIVWGYEEPTIKKIKDTAKSLFNITINIDDHFGLFKGQNYTDDGTYTVFTGVDDVSRFGVIDKWNGFSYVDYWTTNESNMINGTDGTIFPPFVDKSNTLYLFSTDICRSIYVTYDKDVTLKDIPLYHFVAPPAVFLNSELNPGNQGFCTPPTNCLPSGLLNTENCKSGAPVVFSNPHFLQADPSVMNSVGGLSPNINKHQTFIDLDPNTGAAMNVAKRLQVNIEIQNISLITSTKHLHKMYFPVMWLDENAALTDKLANEYKDSLWTPEKILHGVEYGLVALGAVIIIVAVVLIVLEKRKRPKELVDLTSDESNLVEDQ